MSHTTFKTGPHSGWSVFVIAVCIGLFGTIDILKGNSTPVHLTMAADTVTVEGQITVVGSEPFTRMRIVEKGGGGYILALEEDDRIELRREGPTEVRIVGVPYRDIWQGKETPHLRVVRWEYVDAVER